MDRHNGRVKDLEPAESEPVTELLLRWRAGDQECLNRLLPLVESELRRIAHRYMRMERHILVLNELGVHPDTVIRDWGLAKVWLKRELSPKGAHAG